MSSKTSTKSHPTLADVYAVLMQHQIFVINQVVRTSRDSAWRFATRLNMQPGVTRPLKRLVA